MAKILNNDPVVPTQRNPARPRLRQRVSMHIYVLPNLLTTGNMFFGFYAIVQAIQDNFIYASYAIVAAAVFDLLDGRVARLTKSESKFGAEYDSLSDLTSFGLAPGILLYLWALHPFGRMGWLASFLFAACGALRLARFNVQKGIIEKAYFQGLPIPMAAGIVASSVLAFDDLEISPERNIGVLIMTFLLAFVMVSNFRYRSFKDVDLRQRLPFTYLVLGILLFVIIAYRPEVMLFALFLTYALLGAFAGVLRFGLRRKGHLAAARNDGDALVMSDWGEDDLHEAIEEDLNPQNPTQKPQDKQE